MAAKTYCSHSPGLRLVGVAGGTVEFVGQGNGSPGVDELDILRRRGRGRSHSGERNRAVGRGTFRTSDEAAIRELDAHPSNPSLFWAES
jgi:hypothetical protein